MKAKKLVLCILLSVALTVTFIPVMSFAQGGEANDQEGEDIVLSEEILEPEMAVEPEENEAPADVAVDEEVEVAAKENSNLISSISLTVQAPACGTLVQYDSYGNPNIWPIVTVPTGANYEVNVFSGRVETCWYDDAGSDIFTMKGGNTYTAEIWLRSKDNSIDFATKPTINIPGGTVIDTQNDGSSVDGYYFGMLVKFQAVHNYSHAIYGTGYLTNGVECDKCTGCGAEVNGRTIGGWSTKYVKSAKAKKGKKSLTVKWKKQSKKNLKKFDGYEIRYSTSNDINTAKAISVSKKAKSKKIGKLAKKTKYYVWISSYKNVNGVRNYSSWSWGTVKTK